MVDDQEPERIGPGEHDDAVRALLAELASPPVPPEVAGRLDAVLDDLAGEPGSSAHGSSGHESSGQGVRRRWGALLAAATVAGIVGLGLSQVLGPGAERDAATSAADATTESDAGADLGAGAIGGSGEELASGDEIAPEAAPQRTAGRDGAFTRSDANAATAGPPAVRSATFALEAPALVAALEQPDPESTPSGRYSATEGEAAADRADPPAVLLSGPAAPPRCAVLPAAMAGDRSWAIRLDGRAGVLVVHRTGIAGAGPGERVAEAWQCRDLREDPTAPARASTVVPAP